ncbi:MAG: hypothetical protein H6821_05980 [Planctomycetaceae bacterium]|nr:hypothetical protein [Planctomycetales bacterium]MCB9873710.1 hypothetical protein [Planctomycetaceae bacterium]MCB9938155.1 hypothetical protein [Planctomycetaceae bacterium]
MLGFELVYQKGATGGAELLAIRVFVAFFLVVPADRVGMGLLPDVGQHHCQPTHVAKS